MNDYYVYVFFRPWDGQPCYIGKGRRHRWLEHERLGENHYNLIFARIMKKAARELPKVKLREGLSAEEAAETEKAFIAAIGRKAHGGPLVNLTDGGDGTSGWQHTQRAKDKIAVAAAGRVVRAETCEKLRIANLGKRGFKHSEEFKDQIRRVHTGRVKSPQEREAIRVSKVGHEVSSETRAKIRAALIGRKNGPISEEHRANLRKAKLLVINTKVIEEALRGDESICALARKYSLPRRTLNERVLEAKRNMCHAA